MTVESFIVLLFLCNFAYKMYNFAYKLKNGIYETQKNRNSIACCFITNKQ